MSTFYKKKLFFTRPNYVNNRECTETSVDVSQDFEIRGWFADLINETNIDQKIGGSLLYCGLRETT